ncbi:MAG: translational machinery protein [Polyangiales bacterium]
MASNLHTALWLDHQEARIFHVDRESFDESKVKSPQHHFHRHAKGAAEPHEHPQDQSHFFAEVAKALAGAEQILILGPSTAKLQFVRYLHQHDKALEAKVVGLETVDHPTDKQIVSYAKHYFKVPEARVH